MRVCGAAPRMHFFGIVHFKHTHTGYSKILLVACLVHKYAHLGRHAKKRTFVSLVHFKTARTRYPTTFLVACLVQRYACLGRHPTNTLFWHCAFQTHPYYVCDTSVGGMFGAALTPNKRGAPRCGNDGAGGGLGRGGLGSEHAARRQTNTPSAWS